MVLSGGTVGSGLSSCADSSLELVELKIACLHEYRCLETTGPEGSAPWLSGSLCSLVLALKTGNCSMGLGLPSCYEAFILRPGR